MVGQSLVLRMAKSDDDCVPSSSVPITKVNRVRARNNEKPPIPPQTQLIHERRPLPRLPEGEDVPDSRPTGAISIDDASKN